MLPLQYTAVSLLLYGLRYRCSPRISAAGFTVGENTPMHPSLSPLSRAALARICQVHGIYRLSLFGSQLKGTAGPDSDVDLLVEFQPGMRPTLLGMAQIESELSRALGGRKVDLRTSQDLSRFFRGEGERMAEVQYVAG